jgi:hypothetical protein
MDHAIIQVQGYTVNFKEVFLLKLHGGVLLVQIFKVNIFFELFEIIKIFLIYRITFRLGGKIFQSMLDVNVVLFLKALCMYVAT